MNWSTKVFLVLLQLAIGWHFLYEGLWKVKAEKKWSSKPYLQAANGPTGPAMRWSAGDPSVQRDGVSFNVDDPKVEVETYFAVKPIDTTVPPVNRKLHQHLPPALEKEWDAYFQDYLKSYGLDKAPAPTAAELEKTPPEFLHVLGVDPQAGPLAGIPWGAIELSWVSNAANYDNEGKPDPRVQRFLAERRYQQMKAETVDWMLKGEKKVKRPNFQGPAAESTVKVPQRLQEYLAADKKVHDLEAGTVTMFGHKGTPELKKAKDDAAAIRTELLGDVRDQTNQMKLALRNVLSSDQQRMTFMERYRLTDRSFRELRRTMVVTGSGEQQLFSKTVLEKLEPLRGQTFDNKNAFIAAVSNVMDENDRPAHLDAVVNESKVPAEEKADWSRLKMVDSSVRWGLVVIGALLVVGLFTRLACVAGALFLLSFYLAMPAFPWLPEPAMSEGHYLFVNKNIIEMLALLAIAASRPGQRYGLDLWVRLIVGLFRGKRRDEKAEEYRTIAVKVPADAPPEPRTMVPTESSTTRSDPTHAS